MNKLGQDNAARNEAATRRMFLKTLGVAGATTASMSLGSTSHAQEEQTSDTVVDGKDQRLEVLKAFPAVLETPTELLADSHITPVDLLFVRNNQQPKDAATTKAATLAGWRVAIDGLVSKSIEIDGGELAQLPQTEYEMVLQCSGNSRSLFAETVKTGGTQWGRGGMGNVRFAGVKLSTLLEKKNVRVKSSAKYIAAEGRDTPLPGKEDFEHSLPGADVLERSILATHLNGEALPTIHGGPLRLVTPGVYGTMQLKWLSRLRFEAEESTNHNHIPRYRVPIRPIEPGAPIDYTFENSSFNWAMKVKSVVLTPVPNAKLSAGLVKVQGVAFNDGRAPIDSVVISVDAGTSWRRAKLTHPESPYAWTKFEIDLRLRKGSHSIWARATDGLGRSQPLDGSIAWNPSGYEWNGVEKIDVEITS